MTILVTGATGFIGTYVVEHLLKQKYKVIGYDFREALKPRVHSNYVEYIGDIREDGNLEGVFKSHKIRAVIHLAAIPSIEKGSEELYNQVNLGGTVTVVKLAKKYNVASVIYTSSSTVYGQPKVLPIAEVAETPPIGKYGKTKLEAENCVLDYNSKGQKGIVIRPRVVMGPGRMGIFDLLFNAIYKSNLIPIIGTGKNRFQFTDVRDLSEVIVKFIGAGRGGVYNVGCDTKLTVHQLLTQSIKSVGSGSKILKTPSWPIKLALTLFNKLNISPLMEEQYNIANLDFVLDTTKVKSELNWKPKHTDVECLVNAYNWWVKEKKYEQRQFAQKFGLLGKFKTSHQSGFQKGK